MRTYRILFLGDIVGRPGRDVVLDGLPFLRDRLKPEFVIANGENAAAGVGITPSIADELFDAGIDALTLGNHAFNKREIYDYLDTGRSIVRPGNMPEGVPGRAHTTVEKAGVRLLVANLCGRVFMDGYDDPFAAVDRLIAAADTPHILLDFHAEATSEKRAMGFHVDGRVSAVLGTHTHVATCDAHVLPGRTAYVTDVGMCGPMDSVIGMNKEIILRRFRTSLPIRFEVADGRGVISAVVVDVELETGRATAIERVEFAMPG